MPSQHRGQLPGGHLVAGVGPGTQPVQVAALFQQVDQPQGRVSIAGVGPGTQPVQVAALGQQIGQPPSGVPVAGTGQQAQDLCGCVEVAALFQQPGQPEGREATYGRTPAASSFAGLSERVLTCASLSKAYGAPGLRIGWLTVPDPRLREQLRLAKFNSSICCGVLDEFLAARLLSRADQLLRSRGALMADARAAVGHWVGEQDGRLKWLRPEAGAFCCTRLNPDTFGLLDVRRFYDRLAERRTVVAPGPWFGDSAQVMRIGLAYETDGQLEKGLEVISDALRP